VSAHTNLAIALRQSGNVDGALKHFRACIEIDPAYAPGHLNLGLLYAEQGDFDRAIQAFEAALRIDPSYLQADQALRVAMRRKAAGKN
jgi:Tfp pilus assembly protein PilF